MRTYLNEAQAGGTELGIGLTTDQCTYLMLRIAEDLGQRQRLANPGPAEIAAFFTPADPSTLAIAGRDAYEVEALFDELVRLVPNADTYFHCLSALQKRRLKYARILQYQPIPTILQVGPRGLLQYGSLSSRALSALLFWRKWMFDIDNRAGQETGYVFEPIVVRSIGGTPAAAKTSPVRRRLNPAKGRQVDCILDGRAYEIKLRITIAASGQGRWGEEKDFPADCVASGFVPVLIVFDDTQADKLDELTAIFEAAGGEVYIGAAAWQHLEDLSGETIAVFVEKYVRAPLADLLTEAPARDALPDLSIRQTADRIVITIDGEELSINRPKDLRGAAEIASDDVDALAVRGQEQPAPLDLNSTQLGFGFETTG
ncbi:hypothetical protein ACVWYF_000749 [Hymenobacter sp. UYAg731]